MKKTWIFFSIFFIIVGNVYSQSDDFLNLVDFHLFLLDEDYFIISQLRDFTYQETGDLVTERRDLGDGISSYTRVIPPSEDRLKEVIYEYYGPQIFMLELKLLYFSEALKLNGFNHIVGTMGGTFFRNNRKYYLNIIDEFAFLGNMRLKLIFRKAD